MEIEQRLAAVAETLTPAERRIAEAITEDTTALAFNTVADFAGLVATSGPTVVRFATKLGFDGYSDLQASARQALSNRLNSPTQRLRRRAEAHGLPSVRAAATEAIDSALELADGDTLGAMAAMIATTAGNVWLIASETSSPVAHILAANLRLVRTGVRHLTGSAAAIAGEIVDATSGDVVIAIDFERYERTVTTTTGRLLAAGASVVAVTDGPLSPLAAMAERWVSVTVPAIGPFDSAIPALAVAEVLTAEVATLLRPGATDRLQHIEDGWLAYDVFQGRLS